MAKRRKTQGKRSIVRPDVAAVQAIRDGRINRAATFTPLPRKQLAAMRRERITVDYER